MSLLDTASLIVTPNGYKEGTLYSVIPSDGSGDMSVVRATTATRVNSAGLVELVPYNLLQYSEQYNNAIWNKGNASITANAITAPNGTTTADYFVPNTTLGIHECGQSVSVINGTYTHSVYAKKGGYKNLLVWFDNHSGGIGINLDNLSIFRNQNLDSYEIESLANGWVRISITATLSVSSQPNLYAYSNDATPSLFFAGDGTSGIYIWGSQLVEGTLPKDYQKTETRLNIPRLDYSNGTCPSLLVEPQRTNISLRSEDFNTAPWQQNGAFITSNSTTAPNGNLTADTFSTAQGNLLFQGINVSIGQTYTISCWVKLGTATNLCLVVNNQIAWNTIGGQSFDSSDGLNTTTWTRVSYTFTSLSLGVNFHIGGNDEIGLTQSTGTVFIWGAQLEAGNYSTSYIPTTSASVTRNADVVSKTGISSLIGQTEGTMFLDVDFTEVSDYNGWFMKDVANFDTFAFIQRENTGIIAVGYYGSGALQARIETAPSQPIGRYKIGFGYKNNDFVLYINGTQIGTDTSGSVSGLMNFLDAHYSSTGSTLQNAIALWKTRLTNTQLAQLTTI